MSYTITLSNGDVLTTLQDGKVDQISSDIALIGRNVTGFGQYLNQDLVRILENFANVNPPNNPIIGQLWFNSASSALQVYTLTGWRSASGPIVSDNEPVSFSTGDLWIDSRQDQMYFYDGTNLVLVGPPWGRTQGISGFKVETLFDSNGNSHTVLFWWIADEIFATLSNSEFTPSPLISGFDTIKRGLQTSNLFTSALSLTASNSLELNGYTSDQFMKLDTDQLTTGQIYIHNNGGITVGSTGIGTFYVPTSTSDVSIKNNSRNGNIVLKTTDGTGTLNDIVYVQGTNGRVGILNNFPTTELDVNGTIKGNNLTIDTTALLGNLTVSGNDIASDDNLSLSVPGGSNIVLNNSPRIAGLATPVSNNDAANKVYVDDSIKSIPLAFTFVDNGLSPGINDNIILMLNDIAPPADYITGKTALVHAQEIDFISRLVNRYLKRFIIDSNHDWVFDTDLIGTTPNRISPPA